MVEPIRQLGNYRMLRLLGHGGFADVYLGSHIYLETQAAIKVLHTRLVSEGIEPFKQEARTIARLDHPHIVRILDFGVQEGIPFLVMSYAPNGTLRRYHPRGSRVPLWQVVSYVQQVASALHYAHERHVIHRDIKPENLLIGANQQILLSDFGIARTVSGSQSLHTQELAGTIAYMAPEQLKGHSGPSSDQYSLGVLAYEWLSGQRPFEGEFTELALKLSSMPVPSLQEKVPDLPPAVEEVILTALQKNPHERFPSVQTFAAALELAYDKAQTQQAASAPLASSQLPAWPAAAGPPPSPPVEVASSPSQEIVETGKVLMPILSDLSVSASQQSVMPDASAHKMDASSQSWQADALPVRSGLSRRTVVLGLVGLTALAGTGASLLWLTRSATPGPTSGASVSRRSSSPLPSVADASLTSSGAMFGLDLEHTHYNPAEQQLSPDTVPRLIQHWASSTGGSITSSPAVANGVVYVGSGDGRLYAFETSIGKQLWTFSTGDQVNASPAVTRKAVYIGSRDSKIYAVDRTSGQPLWSVITGDLIESSPAVTNGIVYIGSNDYRLYALDATTGKILWSPNIRYFIRSSPAVSNGIVYVGSPDTQLYAFDARTGDTLWAAPTGGEITSSPAVANGMVYVGSVDGNLYAFHATTSKSVWSGPTNDSINFSSPAIAHDIVYIGSDDGKLYAFHALTGKSLWSTSIGSRIQSSPTVANGVVYVGSDNGELYAFHALTGHVLWSTSIGSRIQSSPTVANGVVYVGSDDGKLYAFHLPG